jgi:outer membrane protein TolC
MKNHESRSVKQLIISTWIAIFILSQPSVFLGGVEDLIPLTSQLSVPAEGYDLSLEEAIRIAILRSFNIKIYDLDQKVKREEIMKSKSIHDTTFDAAFEYEQNNEQNASTIAGSREITGSFDVNLEKKIPTGTTLLLSMEHERTSTDSSFSSLNPTFRSVAKVGLKQSVLKNWFGYLDRAEVKLVKLDVERFDHETRTLIEEAITEVLQKYWDLVEASEAHKARVQAYRRAEEFWKITEDKFSFGLSDKADLLAAEANVRSRLSDALVSRHELESRIHEIRVLLDLPGSPWVVPTEAPALSEFSRSFLDSLTAAFNHRRDYMQLKLDLTINQITVRMKKNSLWPELDLEGSFASNALDLDVVKAEGEAFEAKYPTYYAIATFKIPLENREARAEVRQAKYEKEKKILELKKLERQIYRDVDGDWREVSVSLKRATQSVKVEFLQAEKLEEEQKNFKQGRSSAREIIDYQDDLIEARLRAIEHLVLYEQSKVALLRTENTLLEYLGMNAS